MRTIRLNKTNREQIMTEYSAHTSQNTPVRGISLNDQLEALILNLFKTKKNWSTNSTNYL